MVNGYCMKDRQSVQLVNPVYDLNSIGRAVAIGTCPICKGKVHAILKAEDTPADLKAKVAAFKAKAAASGAKKGGSRKSRGSRKAKTAAKPAQRRSRKSAGKRK